VSHPASVVDEVDVDEVVAEEAQMQLVTRDEWDLLLVVRHLPMAVATMVVAVATPQAVVVVTSAEAEVTAAAMVAATVEVVTATLVVLVAHLLGGKSPSLKRLKYFNTNNKHLNNCTLRSATTFNFRFAGEDVSSDASTHHFTTNHSQF
jgi:hypothetical protein